jgi:peptidoglycan/LPS O-acetylase OafA/YrhL
MFARSELHADRASSNGHPETATADQKNPALTGLRAIAALLVVGTHAAFATGALNQGYLGHIYARLEVGVAIFFALSGFLLFRPWVRRAAAGARAPDTTTYARRRARRILPAYLITVLLTFGIYTVFRPGPNPGQTWEGLLRYLTLTQTYTDNFVLTYLHPGLSQMWSLAVEVSFYVALPALAFLLLAKICRGTWRPGLLLGALSGLAAVSPLWLAIVYGTDWLPSAAGMWLPAHLAWFVSGMAVAVLQAAGVRCRAVVALPIAVAAFLLAATEAGGHIIGPDEPWMPIAKSALYALAAVAALAPVALGDGSWYTRLLGSRPLVWLGEISYEIFLLHVVVMALMMNRVLGWPLFTGSLPWLYLATLAVTVPLAMSLRMLTDPRPAQASARSAGTNSASARPRCDAASFSAGLSCAAERSEPTGTKIGS